MHMPSLNKKRSASMKKKMFIYLKWYLISNSRKKYSNNIKKRRRRCLTTNPKSDVVNRTNWDDKIKNREKRKEKKNIFIYLYI